MAWPSPASAATPGDLLACLWAGTLLRSNSALMGLAIGLHLPPRPRFLICTMSRAITNWPISNGTTHAQAGAGDPRALQGLPEQLC